MYVLCLFVYDEVEPIPEENPEEPGDQEAAAAYENEGKSHQSLTLTMIDPK